MTDTKAPPASLSEACGGGNIDEITGWTRRLSASPSTDETVQVADGAEHAWHINARDAEGRTAFHWCVSLRMSEVAIALLERPFCCNPINLDAHGTTSLASAVSAQSPLDVLRRILAHTGATPEFVNSADASGNTPLLIASLRANREVVEMLLKAGANPLHASALRLTALHKAAARGNMEVAEAIISFVRQTDPKSVKRFVNFQDSNGDTALHHAAAENNKEFGEMLLRNGADRTLKNKAGHEYWQVN